MCGTLHLVERNPCWKHAWEAWGHLGLTWVELDFCSMFQNPHKWLFIMVESRLNVSKKAFFSYYTKHGLISIPKSRYSRYTSWLRTLSSFVLECSWEERCYFLTRPWSAAKHDTLPSICLYLVLSMEDILHEFLNSLSGSVSLRRYTVPNGARSPTTYDQFRGLFSWFPFTKLKWTSRVYRRKHPQKQPWNLKNDG